MKKKAKLILVPHDPEKWEVGMFVLMRGQLCKLIKQWLNKQKWQRKIQPVQLFLISEEDFVEGQEYNDLVANFDDTNWIVFKTDRLLPSFKKILATPEQIGLFSFKDSEPSSSSLNSYYISVILDKDGNCEVEVNENGPVLVDGKAIIHL